MPLYEGSCHCGKIRFQIDTHIIELTTCDCSLCNKKNALMVKVQEGKFKLLTGSDSLTEYRWNTDVARHFFCAACGIYTFHKKRSEPNHYSINVRCLDDFAADDVPIRSTDGVTMTVIPQGAQNEWPGPRITDTGDT